jgi:hypothetical protein
VYAIIVTKAKLSLAPWADSYTLAKITAYVSIVTKAKSNIYGPGLEPTLEAESLKGLHSGSAPAYLSKIRSF